MPVATMRPSVINGLTPLLKEAAVRAERLGRPVLASYTTHLGPAADFDAAALAGQPDAFTIEQPARGFAIGAWGQAVRLTASGEGRFLAVRTQLAQLLHEAVIRQESGAALRPTPLSLAGFSFDEMQVEDPAWFGFPEAQVAVPRLLFTRSGSHLFLTASALVDPQEGPPDASADLATVADRLLRECATEPRPSVPCRFLDPGPHARDLWNESVDSLTGAIAAGEAEKVVLARRVGVEAGAALDPRPVLGNLRQRFPECTIFAVRSGDACFVGATPEMLVSLQGRRVRADCLAGSARRGASAEQDDRLAAQLLSDDKELREHAYVARGIEESLARFCSDTHHPGEPGLKRMANVQHLHTPIQATTDTDRHVLDLVEALHPTAATAGLPRKDALRLLQVQEPFSRGWYAGPLGWIDAEGGGEFFVALRSALLRDDVASLYAGCGIVNGSQPEREWAESEIKLEAMLWALNASR